MEKTIEERAVIHANKFDKEIGAHHYSYCIGATEQKAIDKELIEMLIGELYTSRAYHLGITGLDSDAEIARKVKEGDCALIRGIDRTINYVKEAMKNDL